MEIHYTVLHFINTVTSHKRNDSKIVRWVIFIQIQDNWLPSENYDLKSLIHSISLESNISAESYITFPLVFESIRLTIWCQSGTNIVVGEEIPMTTCSLVIYMYKKAVNGFLLTNRKNHKLFLLTNSCCTINDLQCNNQHNLVNQCCVL